MWQSYYKEFINYIHMHTLGYPLAPYTPYTIVLHIENPAPFLYTSSSILPDHSVLTDVQQATMIICRSRGEETRPEIWMGSEVVANRSTANSATIWLDTRHPNGLYHCLSAQSQREYFSFFLRKSSKLYLRIP